MPDRRAAKGHLVEKRHAGEQSIIRERRIVELCLAAEGYGVEFRLLGKLRAGEGGFARKSAAAEGRRAVEFCFVEGGGAIEHRIGEVGARFERRPVELDALLKQGVRQAHRALERTRGEIDLRRELGGRRVEAVGGRQRARERRGLDQAVHDGELGRRDGTRLPLEGEAALDDAVLDAHAIGGRRRDAQEIGAGDDAVAHRVVALERRDHLLLRYGAVGAPTRVLCPGAGERGGQKAAGENARRKPPADDPGHRSPPCRRRSQARARGRAATSA